METTEKLRIGAGGLRNGAEVETDQRERKEPEKINRLQPARQDREQGRRERVTR